MKKLCLLILCSFVFNTIDAQNIIDKHYEHFVEQDNSTVVHVSALTFQYAAHFVPDNDEEEREIKEFVESIKSFDLVTVPDLLNAKQEYRVAVERIDDSYDELINIKEENDVFSVYIDEEDGIVYELVGVGAEENQFIVFSLLGEMRLDQIGKMMSKVQSEKFAPLKQAKLSSVNELRVYPNPINADNQFQIDIPEEMIGGKAFFVDPKGAKVSSFEITQTNHKVNTTGLTPGQYVLSIENNGVNMKKKVLIVR